jgi:hypothetical protein
LCPCGIRADEEDADVKPVAGARQITVTEQTFERMVFGEAVKPGQAVDGNGVRVFVAESISATDLARRRMLGAIDSELQWLDGGCRLTNAQKKKLRLAGRGDIDSFFSRAADLHAKVIGRALDQQEYRELSAQMTLLRMASEDGLLNAASLFRKTLRGTLDERQRADYQQLLRQRQLAAAETGLSTWDRAAVVNDNIGRVNAINTIKLSAETRRKICELIVAQGRLPESSIPNMNYIVLLEADRIADQVRPLMDDEQWEAFQQLVIPAKRVEPAIRRYAQWPPAPVNDEDEVADDR